MTKDKVEELKEKFDTLIELGVVFRYGSEDIEQGEITNIEFTEDDTVKLELMIQLINIQISTFQIFNEHR